jgi:hypothetical protein
MAPRAGQVHFHLDVDGERLCEDTRCPHRGGALHPAPFEAMRKAS